MLTLTYICHSCFLLDTPDCAVVFDYWKDPTAEDSAHPRFLDTIPPDKPFYVVVSHHHKDHFVKEIFDWKPPFSHIHYILSKDVARHARHYLKANSLYRGVKLDAEDYTVMRPGDTFTDSSITVKAFGSTDTGNSYVVDLDGRHIFHAGDLNAWMWKDESSPAEVAEAIQAYNRILAGIASEYPALDIAMMPVDSRIGTDYFTGAAMLVRIIDVRRFIPMHFALGSEEEQRRRRRDALAFDLYANPNRGEYIGLASPYDRFSMA